MTATKNFLVESWISGLAIKSPCAAVAGSNITLAGEQTINGVPVVANDRVLVTGQTDPIDNGIYDAKAGSWSRSQDFDGNRDIVFGTLAQVALPAGTTLYRVTSTGTIVIGTTAITFQTLGNISAWVSTAADFTIGAGQKHLVVPAGADIDVTIATGLLAGDELTLHTSAAQADNAIIAPGTYTIRGPVGTVVAPDTLVIAPGETVVLVADGAGELEIV